MNLLGGCDEHDFADEYIWLVCMQRGVIRYDTILRRIKFNQTSVNCFSLALFDRSIYDNFLNYTSVYTK